MEERTNTHNNFINQAKSLILEHASDEKFGVSELAAAMAMSRSNLLRRIKKETELSASQFIRQVRLGKGMELLQQSSSTVSEVSFEVGFASVSYFIKCFREYYGYPPGEVGKRMMESSSEATEAPHEAPHEAPLEAGEAAQEQAKVKKNGLLWGIMAGTAFVLIAVMALFYVSSNDSPTQPPSRSLTAGTAEVEKSIAVLPFKNESTDSSNLYFVNGLMESTLSNLQKISDLRVISRTSSEKYRSSSKSIPEIAQELNVSYVVEGSGQRIGDQVLLNIQLIEASGDRHIWAEQYSRKVTDIFDLQNEVAKEIAHAIEAIVTPVELELLEKKPTENLEAYDLYLQALPAFYTRTTEGLQKAIPLFEQAIEYDEEFALAYANIALSYYYLDIFQAEKQFTEKINTYSDKALLYDSKSDVCLISKACYYLETKDYRLALPHLEKALEYNPNSSAAVHMLSVFHAYQVPNTAKYLEYALKGIQLDVAGEDSVTKSFSYLHLGHALVQTGFFDEALKYVNRSLDLNPANPYAPHLKIFILFARDHDLLQTQQRIVREWKKDTSRLDILQDVGKIFYTQGKMDSAYFYFEKFDKARKANNLDIYTHENSMIAFVYKQMGKDEEAAALFDSFSAFCVQDESIYSSAHFAMKYAYEGDDARALEQLEAFSKQHDFQYWFLLLEGDPMVAHLKDLPKFKTIMQRIKDRFWRDHHLLRNTLEEEGLL